MNRASMTSEKSQTNDNKPENPFQNYELAKNYLKYNRNFSV